MINYSNSKIYKIVCMRTKQTYIGSTTTSLAERLSQHVRKYKQWKNGLSHTNTGLNQILDRNVYKIILIEKYPCKDKSELISRESHYQLNEECVNYNVDKESGSAAEESESEEIIEIKKNLCIDKE